MVKKIRVKKKRTQAQTPAPKKDRIRGSKKNPKGSASGARGGIEISESAVKTLENYRDEHNEKYSAESKKVDLGTLKAVFRRGAGAFSASHRPQVTSRTQWALARVKAFLKLVGTGQRKKSYTTDLDLLPKGHPQRTEKEKKTELLSIPDKYSHIDFTPPKGVQEAAERGLEIRRSKPESQRGGTEVGVARARDLSNGIRLSPDTVKRMLAYFTRHEVDKQGSTWDEQGKGFQAWLLWGGDPGFAWSRKVVNQMKAADTKANKLTAYSEISLLNEIKTYDVPDGLTIGKPFKTLSLGQVSSRMNGEPIGKEIDSDLLSEMVRVFNIRKDSDPVIIDWQHATSPFQEGGVAGPDAGNALGIIVDLEVRDSGLYAIPAYNERGLKVVKDAGGILWSSPEYLQGEIFTRDGGDKVGDAQLLAVTLTPRPAQQSDKIDRITLKESLTMYSQEQLNAMNHDDLVDFAKREQDLNRQKDEMIKQLESQIKTMNEDNESKVSKDAEDLNEHYGKEEKLAEHDEKKEEKLAEHDDKEKMKEEEDKKEKMKEHQKMSESLNPSLLSEIQALREQVQSLQKEKIEVEKSTAVNQLLSEGKISPNEEGVAREAYDLRLQGRDSFWNMFSERPANSVVNMSTIGHGASGQEINKESLHLKVKKLSEDKGISYSQALSEFRTSNPSEYNQAYGV